MPPDRSNSSHNTGAAIHIDPLARMPAALPVYQCITLTPLPPPHADIYNLQLNNGRVNALSHQLMRELLAAVAHINSNSSIAAVVLTSALATTFSAGMDLAEAVRGEQPSFAAAVAINTLVDTALSCPLSCTKPIAVVVAGHCIAGAFFLASSCDYIAISSSKQHEQSLIGVTELLVGYCIMPLGLESLRLTLGSSSNSGSSIRRLLYCGELHSPSVIHTRYGWGDSHTADAFADAVTWLSKVKQLDAVTFAATKHQLNSNYHQLLQQCHDNDDRYRLQMERLSAVAYSNRHRMVAQVELLASKKHSKASKL